MEKVIYHSKTKNYSPKLKENSELVTKRIDQAGFLMEEVYHHPSGITIRFDYWITPNVHVTEITAFGSKDKISKIKKELS